EFARESRSPARARSGCRRAFAGSRLRRRARARPLRGRRSPAPRRARDGDGTGESPPGGVRYRSCRDPLAGPPRAALPLGSGTSPHGRRSGSPRELAIGSNRNSRTDERDARLSWIFSPPRPRPVAHGCKAVHSRPAASAGAMSGMDLLARHASVNPCRLETRHTVGDGEPGRPQGGAKMTSPAYDRLTALDSSFLLLETPHAPLHVASTLTFEAGPLRTPQGGVDADAIRARLTGELHRIPRYRQKIAWVPFTQRPVWVDDHRFNIDYHVRHTSLPRPGDEQQLKRLSARIMEQSLDPSRPLWEMWVVEGLEGGDRFALISKVHHCMIDGISGVDLLNTMLSPTPEVEPHDPPRFIPRRVPTAFQLWRDEMLRRLRLPVDTIRDVGHFVREAADLRRELLSRARAIAGMLGTSLSVPSATPLNDKIGPHRRFDWLEMSLDESKQIRRALGGSINDVVLTVVTGAVQRFLERRNVNPGQIDFRVMAPVSVRSTDQRGKLGNRVSAWFLDLP